MPTDTGYDFSKLEKFMTAHKEDIHHEMGDNSYFVDPGIESIKSRIKAGDKVLDVGCGHGYAMKEFSKLGVEPIGITLDPNDIEKGQRDGRDVRFMDMSFLEFPDKTFDIVWARQCVEHSLIPFLTLTEFNRVLKPGGLIYMEVPSPNTTNNHELDPNHYSVFGEKMWFILLRRAMFEAVDLYMIDFESLVGPDTYFRFIGKKFE